MTTPPRPPHPAPNVQDDHDTPLIQGGTGRDIQLIWVRRQEAFLKIRNIVIPVGRVCDWHAAGLPLRMEMMAVARAYSASVLFVPFVADLEANFTRIIHADTASIALKGAIWQVSFGCLIVTLTSP
jgi:hypothetical protein